MLSSLSIYHSRLDSSPHLGEVFIWVFHLETENRKLKTMEIEEIPESMKTHDSLARQRKFQILKREIKLGLCFIFVIAAFTYGRVQFITHINDVKMISN